MEWSSKGKRPVSSSAAMTPADQTSEAGVTLEERTSGAMNQGVPSSPSSVRGRLFSS